MGEKEIQLGWQITDPEGNVVDSGEVTVVEIDVLEEITQRLAETKGVPQWQA